MPAITVENTTAPHRLPKLPLPVRQRPIRQVTDAPRGFEGEGFPVRRAWHPHRGFETVTYMMDGVIQHADSIGGGGVIRDGGTQWMTAARASCTSRRHRPMWWQPADGSTACSCG